MKSQENIPNWIHFSLINLKPSTFETRIFKSYTKNMFLKSLFRFSRWFSENSVFAFQLLGGNVNREILAFSCSSSSSSSSSSIELIFFVQFHFIDTQDQGEYYLYSDYTRTVTLPFLYIYYKWRYGNFYTYTNNESICEMMEREIFFFLFFSLLESVKWNLNRFVVSVRGWCCDSLY